MKCIFIGTVQSSYVALESLLKNKIKISAVFTIIDNKFNSDSVDLTPICKKYNIPVYGIENINDQENLEKMKEIQPDYIFVIGFSQLLKKDLLELPNWGCIGFHPTLLPENRGRAVIPWILLQEKEKSGITLFKIDLGMDTGDIILQKEFLIKKNETATSLYKKVMVSLEKSIDKLSTLLKTDNIELKKQDPTKATYCAIRKKENGLINWKESAYEIDKLIRATSKPYPGAYSHHKGKEIIIWDSKVIKCDNWSALPGQRVEILKDKGVLVKTGNGILLIKQVLYNGEEVLADKIFKIPGKCFE